MSNLCAVTHANKDAARKWCPFSSARNSQLYNSGLTGPAAETETAAGGRCLTTGCMAWIDDSDHAHEIAMGRCGLVTLSSI